MKYKFVGILDRIREGHAGLTSKPTEACSRMASNDSDDRLGRDSVDMDVLPERCHLRNDDGPFFRRRLGGECAYGRECTTPNTTTSLVGPVFARAGNRPGCLSLSPNVGIEGDPDTFYPITRNGSAWRAGPQVLFRSLFHLSAN